VILREFKSIHLEQLIVRTAMQVTLPATFNSVLVQSCEYDGEAHMTEDNADFAGVYHIAQDFIINYNR